MCFVSLDKLPRSHINSFSLLLHTTSVILLPFNQPDPQGLHHWSLSFTHQFSQISRSRNAHSGMQLDPHMWNMLPPSLRIPSTGSIPSFSDSHHGPVYDLSYGAFHSRLKLIFSSSFFLHKSVSSFTH